MKKTILITGASSGLGKATAEYFASAGWQVAATMRTPEKATTLTEIPGIQIFKMDVTDNATITRAVADIISTFGKIDVVLNNAGMGRYGALELCSEKDINDIWQTNVQGVVNVIRGVLPHFRANKAGTIINVGSAMGLTTTMPLLSLYHMTKYALEGLTEGLYYELKPLNIDVHMIEPGGFPSELNQNLVFHRREDMKEYDVVTDKIEQLLLHYNDLPLGTVEEIVDVIYALSERKSTQFRTVIGTAANELVARRKSLTDEVFLASSLSYFS
ncbi:SDR family oxidoreductase [Chitinophaga agri]|uniref:SDR family oxidoreductase n=1 Tax=Chitinophaga agri TaxID=2703787 RepID=A0A6B9ZAZ8_9BACT|nr:SDR family oxidoreductase [Chitinophaga agri]QHS59009.1 SDR family oxidoreductase [Chitinophaga agri]